MKQSLIVFTALVFLLLACRKTNVTNNSSGTSMNSTGPADTSHPIPIDTTHYPPTDTLPLGDSAILVDASRDGGVWWYPQGATGYSATNYHQGKPLADYLKKLGYKVDELGRGTIITTALLSKYKNVIRAGAFGYYAPAEMAAYESFLSRPSSLLLLQDHLTNSPNDNLSIRLGVPFEGAIGGTATLFNSHPVTAGVTSFPFIVGSVIRYPDPAKMTIVGSIITPTGTGNYTFGVMGVLHHPSSKIFFIGDVNGIEQLPQPFTSNLVKWLFR